MILVFIIVSILFLLVGGGLWFTFGPGGKDIKDPIAEHAKMHELGIAPVSYTHLTLPTKRIV